MLVNQFQRLREVAKEKRLTLQVFTGVSDLNRKFSYPFGTGGMYRLFIIVKILGMGMGMEFGILLLEADTKSIDYYVFLS